MVDRRALAQQMRHCVPQGVRYSSSRYVPKTGFSLRQPKCFVVRLGGVYSIVLSQAPAPQFMPRSMDATFV